MLATSFERRDGGWKVAAERTSNAIGQANTMVATGKTQPIYVISSSAHV